MSEPSDYRCRHCGALPDPDGDHSCPCPYSDDACPDHPVLRCGNQRGTTLCRLPKGHAGNRHEIDERNWWIQ